MIENQKYWIFEIIRHEKTISASVGLIFKKDFFPSKVNLRFLEIKSDPNLKSEEIFEVNDSRNPHSHNRFNFQKSSRFWLSLEKNLNFEVQTGIELEI